ncbi:MAG TPA: tetratricopeptide repeat protein, partial [Ktedonobacteraceae bacterium]|nr:tetratricopeptide repeat protein [Ktedonobacteraceae bacterium]
MTSMVALAEMLPAFSARHETDQQKLVDAVKHWLRQCQQLWLLIFDNADDIALLRPYLPQQGKGFLLFTTRSHAVGSLAASIEVENMDLMEGTTFLLQRAQRQHVEEDERNEAMNVVISLDGFPLALDQAGAYVEETGCSFKDYIQLYLEHHRVLLARRGMQVTNYPDSVATTWSLSFQKIAETNLAAVELLHLCAFLAPDEIPEELLTSCAEKWPPLLWQAVANRITFDRLLEDLLRFSLIKRQAEKRQFRIHRLVQVVQQDAMAPEEQRQWAERVIRAVHSMFPRDPKADVHSWPQCLRYLEQAQACDTLIQQYELFLPEAAELLDRVGTYLSEHASYTLAESLYQRSLRIWEHQMDQAHPSMTSTLNNLASLYLQQGKYGQAEPLYQRALSLREKQLGANHSLVAQPLNNLAVLYSKQERYAEAEPLFQRALSLREQQVGPDHADLAYPLNGLAELYRRQKRYAEAEPLFQRAL